MEETSNTARDILPMKHDIPKCTSCGNIGNFKTEPIFTRLYVLMGLLLILVWIVPKPSNWVSGDWIPLNAMPWLWQICFGAVLMALTLVPGIQGWLLNVFSAFLGLMSGPSRWTAAGIIGLIYFGAIFIARCNKNKREKVCKNCKAVNRFTFIY